MGKLMLIHEDSDFARIWKELGTERTFDIMSPIKKEPLRFFTPAYLGAVDSYGLPKIGSEHSIADRTFSPPSRRIGEATRLSGLEYHDLVMNPGISFKRGNFKYDGSNQSKFEIDELGQWEVFKPNWNIVKPVGMPAQCFSLKKDLATVSSVTKLLHTDKTFDEDFKLFTEWLKKRLLFKRMDRYDLNRNGFLNASRRYGITFAGQSFTTHQ